MFERKEPSLTASIAVSLARKNPYFDEEDANQFASLITRYLEEINAAAHLDPIRFLTVTCNVEDGIGDYKNQADFNALFAEMFHEYQNIQLCSFSFVEAHKFELAKRITPDIAKEGLLSAATVDELTHLPGDARKILYAIGQPFTHPRIKQLFQSANAVMYVARDMKTDPELIATARYVNPMSFVCSWQEYGHRERDIEYPDPPFYFHRKPMGVREEDAGIKIYPHLAQLCAATDSLEKKAVLLESLEGHALRAKITDGTALDFLENTGIGFGYIQTPHYSILFAQALIATSSKKRNGVVMIGNTKYFRDCQKDADFMRYLQGQGYAHVELLSNVGTLQFSCHTELATGKTLTVVDLSGTSDADKEKLIALSEMVAGSGNSSFSEMISSRRLPFIDPIIHVMPFYNDFIDEIGNAYDIPESRALERYLTLNLEANTSVVALGHRRRPTPHARFDLLETVADSDWKRAIMQAWLAYCEFLSQKRNVQDDLNEMVCAFVISQKMADKSFTTRELDELLACLPGGIIYGMSLLHMAIEKKRPDLVSHLLSLPASYLWINAAWGYYQLTPLMLALREGEAIIFEKLTEEGNINLSSKDIHGQSICDQLIKALKHPGVGSVVRMYEAMLVYLEKRVEKGYSDTEAVYRDMRGHFEELENRERRRPGM